MSDTVRSQWSSTFLFFLAAVGSAVGIGNIWRFPYIMGKYGGSVFLLIYIILILFVCAVPLICELSMGQFHKKECIGAFTAVNPKLKFLGWLNVIGGTLICAFYFVVGGWIINYIFSTSVSKQISDYSQYFSSFVSQIWSPYILTLIFLVMCMFFIYRGVNKGIEFGNKIMMPVFLVLLIVLAAVSLNLPDAHKGLEFMFKPDISKINSEMLLAVLGQSLFTLSVGVGCLIVYGSYLKDSADVFKNAYMIIAADTLYAILAGIVIFPAVFSFGLAPDSGAGLVFITLPKVFAQMTYGNIFGVMFFILLLFAALTSAISIAEIPTAAMIENFGFSRHKATIVSSIIIAVIALPASLSFGLLSNFKIFSKTFFDLFDFATANILMPLNALMVCVVIGWFMNPEKVFKLKNKTFKKVFIFFVRYVLPVVLFTVLVCGLI